MEIWLLRHAEAEKMSPTGRDADRRLTAAGRRRMKVIASAIRTLKPQFDGLLTSPLVRAKETMAPVAEALDCERLVEESDALVPEADPERILSEIDRRAFQQVLLVGHMPHFGSLLGLLVAGREGLELEMKKAGLACFESRCSATRLPATLRFFLPPRLLERIGRAADD